jgi:two-component system, cell cycle response regulator
VDDNVRNPSESAKSADYNILLVDDDPAMLRLLGRWLTTAGYMVRAAADGQEAIEAIDAECPDFIVTDWEMPRLNGIDLCRRIRDMPLPHYAYVLILTVKNARAEIIQGLEHGADDFLAKPVSEGELLARLRSGARMLELERRLSLMANTDSLTGLSNQRTFYEAMGKEWHRTQRSRLPLSCVMLDLDFFKRVNDVYGHPAGDAVLRSVAELLQANSRTSDTVCRYGGEEFCIMLPETDENNAAMWAERVRERLASLHLPVGNGEFHLTGSFGVAECREDTQGSEQLVDMADQALLCAKRMGRDQVIRYALLADGVELETEYASRRDRLMQNVIARDVMSPLTACLPSDATIVDAVEVLLRTGVSAVPVMDGDGRLAGFLSEKQLMVAAANSWRQPIRNVMRPHPICYEETTAINIIHDFLCCASIRRVVITNDGRPTGTIDRRSLLQWLYNRVKQTAASERDAVVGTL